MEGFTLSVSGPTADQNLVMPSTIVYNLTAPVKLPRPLDDDPSPPTTMEIDVQTRPHPSLLYDRTRSRSNLNARALARERSLNWKPRLDIDFRWSYDRLSRNEDDFDLDLITPMDCESQSSSTNIGLSHLHEAAPLLNERNLPTNYSCEPRIEACALISAENEGPNVDENPANDQNKDLNPNTEDEYHQPASVLYTSQLINDIDAILPDNDLSNGETTDLDYTSPLDETRALSPAKNVRGDNMCRWKDKPPFRRPPFATSLRGSISLDDCSQLEQAERKRHNADILPYSTIDSHTSGEICVLLARQAVSKPKKLRTFILRSDVNNAPSDKPQ